MSQVVLILVGLVASGKSTFAQALQDHLPNFRRCNQDDLGDRRKVERLARESLQQGMSVCVDRTNFNAQQRSYWINIAREFSVPAWVIVFDTPFDVCVDRLRERKNHPTITDVQQGLMVLAQFRSQFEYPSSTEGYDRILTLTPSEHPSLPFTSAEISSVIERLRSSIPEVSSTLKTSSRADWRNHRPVTGPYATSRQHRSPYFSSDSQFSSRSSTRSGGRFRLSTTDQNWRSVSRTLS